MITQPGSCKHTIVTLLLTISVFLAAGASAADLQDIRTGIRSGFTRIAFQFNGPTGYMVKGDQGEGKLLLTFAESTSMLPIGKPGALAPPIEAITVRQEGTSLKTVIALSISRYRMKAFTLTEPDRVVFDLYPVAAAASQVKLNRMVVKESLENSVAEAATSVKAPEKPPVEQAVQKPVVKETPDIMKPQQPVETLPDQPETTTETAPEAAPAPATVPAKPQAEKPPPPLEKAPPPAKPSPQPEITGRTAPQTSSGRFQTYLFAVLGVISIVILALIGFLLLQRKNSAGKTLPIESGEELKTTADIMASIDAKIREKFKQYEKSNPKGVG